MATEVTVNRGCSYVSPDEGEAIRIFDEQIAVKVAGAETAGAYALLTLSVAPGGGPPLHAHPGSETFYVLSGEFAFTFRDGDGVATVLGRPGTVVNAPGGVAHRFENVGSNRGDLLIVVAPEAVDFLRELGAAFPPGAAPDMERMLAIHARYQVETIHGGEGSRPEPSKGGATSARARALAWEFAHANDGLIAMLERCPAQRWRATCADTGWTIGVQAHHVASNHSIIARVLGEAAEGHPHSPLPTEKLDAINARHAEDYADITRDEVLALLRESGPAAAQAYRVLTDEQLSRAGWLIASAAPTVADLIADLAIGEITRHGEAIRAAIAG